MNNKLIGNKVIRTAVEFRSVIYTALIAFFIFNFVLINCFIPTESMHPTVKEGGFMLAGRLSYKSKNSHPQKGDIIVFHGEIGILMTKRVIGTEGDVIELKGGDVYVNGEKEEEDYVVGRTFPHNKEKYEVPPGKVFLLGDNRENSSDSRFWKNSFIDEEDIVGKAIFEYSLPGKGGKRGSFTWLRK